MEWVVVNVIQHSQPKGFKVKMRGHKYTGKGCYKKA